MSDIRPREEIIPNGDDDDDDDDRSIMIITPRDPAVVHPPTELQGHPWQSRFIFNPNQPWPPVLATRFFPPPPWPENLEGENLTIEPVVGPFLALTEEQMETPPGFGRFVPSREPESETGIDPGMAERMRQRANVRDEIREEERGEERRERRRRGRPRRERGEERGEERREGWNEGRGAE